MQHQDKEFGAYIKRQCNKKCIKGALKWLKVWQLTEALRSCDLSTPYIKFQSSGVARVSAAQGRSWICHPSKFLPFGATLFFCWYVEFPPVKITFLPKFLSITSILLPPIKVLPRVDHLVPPLLHHCFIHL